ncbi:MAG: monovalent cation/H(+) antiporter subunit G [Candidatus Sumerlaeaceae bacterium]|nr:monovalent cation/H(+) antiporter subunit G [Candidatus Sumerlaeaceae bacterium]
MSEIVGWGFAWTGLFFLFVGTLGVLRFEDVYLRIQAASKNLTFGLGFLLPGVALLTGDGGALAKAVVVVAFQFLTAPIAAHVMARSALRRGIQPRKVKGVVRLSDSGN